MELTIDAKDLATVLALPNRAVPSRPSNPVLTNLLLKAEDNTLAVTGSDLGAVTITAKAAASIAVEGEILLPAKLLTDMVGRMDGNLALNWDPETSQAIIIAAPGCSYSLSGQPGEDYPLIERAEGQQLTMEASTLARALESTLVTASNDESKQILCGVHLQPVADGLEVASTDGHRLSVFPVAQEGVEAFTPVTLPSKGLEALGKHLAKAEGMVTITLDNTIATTLDNTIATFDLGDLVFTTRLLEGQYPEYRRLIPQAFAVETLINRQDWIDALGRIMVVASQKNDIVKHQWNDQGQLVLEADVQGSSGRELVGCEASEGQGEDVLGKAKNPMAFNGDYLLDGLKAFGSEQVILHTNTPTSPATITAPGSSQVYLVMPVQIRDQI
jgi:DNA polymerase-3 subunit beta